MYNNHETITDTVDRMQFAINNFNKLNWSRCQISIYNSSMEWPIYIYKIICTPFGSEVFFIATFVSNQFHAMYVYGLQPICNHIHVCYQLQTLTMKSFIHYSVSIMMKWN